MEERVLTVDECVDTQSLYQKVTQSLERYFGMLGETLPTELYDTVLGEVESALFASVMQQTGGNKSKAARMLGMTRNTLRQRLQKYDLL